jgi:hypothetical protein
VAFNLKLIKRALIFVAVFILLPTFAFALSISLEWDEPYFMEEEPAGYIVYYGKKSRQYVYDVDVGTNLGCTISGLGEGVRYFFAVTTYDDDGNESIFSSETCYPNCPNYASASGGGGGGGGCFISSVGQDSASWLLIPGIIALITGLTYFGLRRKATIKERGHIFIIHY